MLLGLEWDKSAVIYGLESTRREGIKSNSINVTSEKDEKSRGGLAKIRTQNIPSTTWVIGAEEACSVEKWKGFNSAGWWLSFCKTI
jgi:hypothetical protein